MSFVRFQMNTLTSKVKENSSVRKSNHSLRLEKENYKDKAKMLKTFGSLTE